MNHHSPTHPPTLREAQQLNDLLCGLQPHPSHPPTHPPTLREAQQLNDLLYGLESRAEQLARKAEQKRQEAQEDEATLREMMGQSVKKKEEEEEEAPSSSSSSSSSSSLTNAQQALGEVDWLPYHLRVALACSDSRLPEGVVDVLREEVFGLDTFYVSKVKE